MSSEPWAAVEEPTERTDLAFAFTTPAKDKPSFSHLELLESPAGVAYGDWEKDE